MQMFKAMCALELKLNGKNTSYKMGDSFPLGELSPRERDRLLKNRQVKPVGTEALNAEPDKSHEVLKLGATSWDKSGEDTNQESRPTLKSELPPPPPMRADGKWNFDPNALEGKTLPELHALIAERDPNTAPPSTVEEARALLSLDHK